MHRTPVGRHPCQTVLWLTVLALVSLCQAQRADDPNASTTINEVLKKQTLSDVERKASEGDAAAQFQLALGYMVGGYLTKDDKLAAEWCTGPQAKGMSLRKQPWGISTRLEEGSNTPTKRRSDGGIRQPIRAARTLNSISENFTCWALERSRTTPRHLNGSERLLNRENPMHSITWD